VVEAIDLLCENPAAGSALKGGNCQERSHLLEAFEPPFGGCGLRYQQGRETPSGRSTHRIL